MTDEAPTLQDRIDVLTQLAHGNHRRSGEPLIWTDCESPVCRASTKVLEQGRDAEIDAWQGQLAKATAYIATLGAERNQLRARLAAADRLAIAAEESLWRLGGYSEGEVVSEALEAYRAPAAARSADAGEGGIHGSF